MVLHILSSIDSVQIEKYTWNHSWVTASWCVGELSSCRPWQGPLFVCACLCECCLCVALFVNVKLSTLLCCSETVWGVGIQRVAWSTCDDFWSSRAHGIISVSMLCVQLLFSTLRLHEHYYKYVAYFWYNFLSISLLFFISKWLSVSLPGRFALSAASL